MASSLRSISCELYGNLATPFAEPSWWVYSCDADNVETRKAPGNPTCISIHFVTGTLVYHRHTIISLTSDFETQWGNGQRLISLIKPINGKKVCYSTFSHVVVRCIRSLGILTSNHPTKPRVDGSIDLATYKQAASDGLIVSHNIFLRMWRCRSIFSWLGDTFSNAASSNRRISNPSRMDGAWQDHWRH